jgi:KDO2-lipid IV(A) lauroyltransferase
MVMQAERDAAANELHDRARRERGLEVVHVGNDPLASLALLRHIRAGGVVALQVDRAPPGLRTCSVHLFGEPGLQGLPEGPLRLAQLTGAPILPIFCARTAFRRYLVDIGEPIHVPPRASPAELAACAQRVADAMTRFLRAHPTQWLMFQH